MEFIFLGLLLVLNLGISYWNAWVCGQSWLEVEKMPLFSLTRITSWAGVVMSGAGFASCITIVMSIVLSFFHVFSIAELEGMIYLAYAILIGPILASGAIITAQSLYFAAKSRDAVSIGIAVWNSWAMAHNVLQALTAVPQAIKVIAKVFNLGKFDKYWFHRLGLALFTISCFLAGGIVTILIVRASIENRARKEMWEQKSAQEQAMTQSQ